MASRIVLVGGGFSMDPDLVLDEYVFGLTGQPSPKVCFVPTASGDSEVYIERFHTMLDARCDTSVLRLFHRDGSDPGATLRAQDVIYVGGGNTANALAVWRVHGVDRALVEAYRAGVLLCGISAGMICWFESSLTDSFGPVRRLTDGLGLIGGSGCPHYNTEPSRRPTYEREVAAGTLAPGWALDDGAAALFQDGELVESVARTPGTHLYAVSRNAAGDVVETAVPARLLV
ncbi:MAG TPA: peptidase E [Pseudonocardia sp.]|nr:peptidase E [Pseudonocardia sp.]